MEGLDIFLTFNGFILIVIENILILLDVTWYINGSYLVYDRSLLESLVRLGVLDYLILEYQEINLNLILGVYHITLDNSKLQHISHQDISLSFHSLIICLSCIFNIFSLIHFYSISPSDYNNILVGNDSYIGIIEVNVLYTLSRFIIVESETKFLRNESWEAGS